MTGAHAQLQCYLVFLLSYLVLQVFCALCIELCLPYVVSHCLAYYLLNHCQILLYKDIPKLCYCKFRACVHVLPCKKLRVDDSLEEGLDRGMFPTQISAALPLLNATLLCSILIKNACCNHTN